MQGAWVPSLVWELGSHMLHREKKKKRMPVSGSSRAMGTWRVFRGEPRSWPQGLKAQCWKNAERPSDRLSFSLTCCPLSGLLFPLADKQRDSDAWDAVGSLLSHPATWQWIRASMVSRRMMSLWWMEALPLKDPATFYISHKPCMCSSEKTRMRKKEKKKKTFAR